MAAPVANLTGNLQSLNEALETAKVAGNGCNTTAAVDSLAENLPSVNETLEGLSISDHKRNMAAALASLTENFQTVNEALEGPFVSDHKRKRVMGAALAGLMENFQTVNEALEGISISDLKLNMAAAVPSWAENFQSVNVLLEKEKKHLLQRVQFFEEEFDEKINEQLKLSELLMKKVDDARGQFDDVNSELIYYTEKFGKLVFGEEADKRIEQQRKLSERLMKRGEKINEFDREKRKRHLAYAAENLWRAGAVATPFRSLPETAL